MSVAHCLLSLVLLGADGGTHRETTHLRYQVKLVEMGGLGWRETLYANLQFVTRQGSATVWTTDAKTADALVHKASRVVMTPRIAAMPDAIAHFSHRTTRRVVTQLTRHADGPVDRAVAVAYTPDLEDVREGCQFTVAGRKLDQGVLIKLVVDESQVAAIHQVKLTEVVKAKGNGDDIKISPRLDVPEVVKTSVEGEWLIPNDGILLVSLGAHTFADDGGKAVVRERLLLLDAGQVEVDAGPQGPGGKPAVRAFTYTMPPRVVNSIPMPMIPSRDLPQPRNADGSECPLPPLPESPPPPNSLPGTSEPCATPQSKGHTEEKSADPDSTKATYQPEAKAPAKPAAAPVRTIAVPVPFWPYFIRIPNSVGVTIDLDATVTPRLR